MSTTTALTLTFREYTGAEKARHLPTLDVERQIFSILDAYLQPSSAISATAAAEEIDKFFKASPPSGSAGYTTLLHLWDLFIGVAEQIPWQHPSQSKLVALIKALRDLPDPTTIAIADWNDDTEQLWTDLPVLPGVLVDNVESHGITIIDDSDHQKRTRIRDINFQGFAARLTTEGVFDISKLAVCRLRDVLEEDPDYAFEGRDEVGPHLDTGILPANVWISLTSKLIFGFCKVNGEGARQNNMGGGKNWKGRVGFSLERWQFWKQRLDEIAINDEASEETRVIAKKMKETMIAAEA